MRLGALSLFGSAIVVSAVVVAQGCAAGDPTPAEDTPNLASRRPLPSATSTATTSPTTPPAPSEDAATPGVDAGGSKDAATSSDTGPQDVFVPPPVDASGIAQAAPGDIVVSELLSDPSGAEPDGEWFEVGLRAASARTLRGLTLEDGAGRTHVVATDVVVSPGKFVVLARSRAAVIAQGVPAADIAYEYGAGVGSSAGVILANGSSGAISILAGATPLVRVPYGAFTLSPAPGTTLEIRATATPGVAVSADYCVSTTPQSTGFGTPGRAPVCP